MLLRKYAAICLFVCLSASSAFSQSTFGSIIGTVKDTSGAIVPGASVRITNTDENATHPATTNASGDYELLNVLPAHYSVTVVSKGFETFTATDLLLVARQTLRVDATLQVGQMSDMVTVESSEEGVIQTDT